MEDIRKKKHKYYLENKDRWKKGGKYYTYVAKLDRPSDSKLEVKHGRFIISFD
tara:strand:+ start:320 stop:478 length:159 start_codon:yes stop_codon:yes gene_type:complete